MSDFYERVAFEARDPSWFRNVIVPRWCLEDDGGVPPVLCICDEWNSPEIWMHRAWGRTGML